MAPVETAGNPGNGIPPMVIGGEEAELSTELLSQFFTPFSTALLCRAPWLRKLKSITGGFLSDISDGVGVEAEARGHMQGPQHAVGAGVSMLFNVSTWSRAASSSAGGVADLHLCE